MHGSEEQNEDMNMEVDLVVAQKSQPTKPKVTFGTWILSNVASDSKKAKGVAHVPTLALVEVMAFFGGVVD
jgi:hypothetical protein